MTRINFNLITQFIIVETYGNIINCASIKVYSYNAFSTVSTPNALLFLKFHLLLRVLLYVHSYMSLSIFLSFLDTMDVPTIKKKWKSLSDSFRIHHKNKQRQPSGSAGTSRKSWVHYEQLQFLCDMQLENEYVCKNL